MKRADAQTIEYWRGQIESLEASGVTRTEYCKQKGLSADSMYYWTKKLGFMKGKTRSNFSKVEIILSPKPMMARENSGQPGLMVTIRSSSGMVIEIPLV